MRIVIKTVLFLIPFIFVFSCSDRSKLKQDLARIQSKEIKLLLNDMKHFINGKDTLILDFADSELKLVVYSDSSACSACSSQKMYLWNRFIEDAMKYQGQLKFYFLFSPTKKDIKSIKLDLRANIFSYPVFIDSKGIFSKENPHLPKNPQLHTFLLDKDNKVILVGSPLNNPTIEEMFYKIIEERLGKK